MKSINKRQLKIGVLMGGKSIEREVSFNSGRTVCDHLDHNKYDVIPIFQTYLGKLYILPFKFLHRGKISDFYDLLDSQAEQIVWDDLKTKIDFLYISVHGRFAEDGTLQGLLETLGIPYLGSKVYASSVGMDKSILRDILKGANVNVPNGFVLSKDQIKSISVDSILKEFLNSKINLPVVVKPVHEGSSFGITVVKDKRKLLEAIKKAASSDSRFLQDVLIEEKLEGMEFVCVCLESKEGGNWFALPITEVVSEKNIDFYDYEQKYMPGRASKITPASCRKEYHDKIKETCLKATCELGFSTISRIDGFLTRDGKIYIIDPNSLTGMGPSTFLFHQAAEIGMSHTDLINYLIETELNKYDYEHILKIEDKNKKMENKKRIAVLLGGSSNEREISLESGRNVCYKLSPDKYKVVPVFLDSKNNLYKLNQKLLIQNSTREISELVTKDLKLNWSDLPEICDFVFIALHGGIGENGSVQGTLQMLGLPYNGSGIFTSSLCIDKFKTSEFLKSNGFDVPKSFLISRTESENKNIELKLKSLSFPMVLKPYNDGCSVEVQKVNDKEELIKKIQYFFKDKSRDKVLIEEFITGMELTCGVFGNSKVTVMPPSKSLASKDILSIKEKFLPGEGENITPAPLSENKLKLIKNIIFNVYKSLKCKGYCRIDCFFQRAEHSLTGRDRLVILEVNTLPALTPATCIFHQAAEIGIRPMDFIDKIVDLGFERFQNICLSKHFQINIQEQI